MTGLYLQMILALALVIGMILLLGTFLKKKQSKDGLMKVIGYQSLGSKKGLAAVRINNEVLVLGITATDLKLLRTYDDIGEEHSPNLPVEKDAAGPGTITDKLKRLKDSLYAAQ
ncbi:MAG: FliO/MopB family protein [Nitrospirae bacterium]|nr:FliO/MopB family protein [Nitrospirota bacterium]